MPYRCVQFSAIRQLLAVCFARLRQIGVQCCDDLRAFADRRGDALHRARTHIADGEDAVMAGFQRLCRAAEHRCARNLFRQRDHIAIGEPIGVRRGADEQEKMARSRAWFPRRCCGFASATFSSMPVLALEREDLGFGHHFDIRLRRDAVAPDSATWWLPGFCRARSSRPSRPGSRETPPPAPPNCLRRQAPLPGPRKAALPAARPSNAHMCLRIPAGWRRRDGDIPRRCAITTARAFSVSPLRQIEREPWRSPLCRRLRDLIRDRHFGAEFLRLIISARHQRHAGDAGREAQIILDARRSARLSAKGAAIQHDAAKPFGPAYTAAAKPAGPAPTIATS